MCFTTACGGPSAPAGGDKDISPPGTSAQERAQGTPAAAKSSPNSGFAAFQAKPCPRLTDADETNGHLITTVADPREGVTVHPGGGPRTVLVKLCNTTGEALRDVVQPRCPSPEPQRCAAPTRQAARVSSARPNRRA